MLFSESLKKTADFKKVYRRRRSRADHLLVMYHIKNHTDGNRLGISVSKKVGNSVVRHHVTRLIRESYRLNEVRFRRGYDIVVVARKAAAAAKYSDVAVSIERLAKKSNIWREDS